MSNDITQAFWYHGAISRAAAESLLELEGDFILRASCNNGQEQFVISCKSQTNYLHIVLLYDQEQYMILEDFEKNASIRELITTYINKKHPVSKLSMTILKRPISNLLHKKNKTPALTPNIENCKPLDKELIDKIISILTLHDPFKLARFFVKNELQVFSKFNAEIFLQLEKSKNFRSAEIERCHGMQYFFEALLVLGTLSKSCLLLDKLVVCCYELIQTLKCDSAAVHILNALRSDTVTRHTKLWDLFKREHIVNYLTYERLLLPMSEPNNQGKMNLQDSCLSLFYLRDACQFLNDEMKLDDISCAELTYHILKARKFARNMEKQIAKASAAVKSTLPERSSPALSEIFSTIYQKKLLLGAESSSFDGISNKIKALAHY